MSSIVKYNGQYLVPISNVGITHSMGSNTNDQCTRPVYSINLNGYLIYNAGSPTSSGTFGDYTADQCENIDSDERLNALLAKHCAIGSLFRDHFEELELGTTTGSPNLKAYPRVLDISLTDTDNPSYWSYSVSLEADNLYCNGTPLSPTGCPCVRSFEESWDISYDEAEYLSESGNNRLWKISHQVSAVGAGVAASGGLVTTPYTCAKDFVCGKKGLNSAIPSTCIDGFNCSGSQYNYYESHSVDIANGSYSLSENWVCCITPYVENYTVETQESSDASCPTVSIQGSIRGFETRVSGIVPATGSKYYNAKTRWDAMVAVTGVLALAEEMSGLDLDENPTSGSVGRNRFTGEISFSYSYRKLPFKWLPNAKFEKVQYGNNWNEDIYSSVNILSGGSVIHPTNYDSSGNVRGHQLRKTTLSINAVYPCGTGISRKGPRFTEPYASELQAVVDYYHPSGDPDTYFTVVDSQNENWSAQEGSYDYSITFASQPTGNCSFF
jgi:hypothetical protein